MSLFDELRARAVEIHVEEHLRARLERGDRLRVKLGLDPTAPDIHVGHLVVLDVLRLFQDHGHTVVLIVGDYTALIGDPSGRSETRPMLTREQVDANARTYFEQVFRVLDRERTEIHGNSEWLAEMAAADILRLLAKATLQQVLQREDFAERMRAGIAIGAHEILYPFNQAYDSVAVRADVEIGGTDQLFNLLFGREIQKAYGQEPQDIAVFPLLEGRDGEQKMSKSLGNYIGVSEPPEEIYGKTMSIPDRLTEKYLRLISGLHSDDLEIAWNLHPRDAKSLLAWQLVNRLYGPKAADDAEADFHLKFRAHEQPAEIEEFQTGFPIRLIEAMVHSGLAKSNSEARRLIEQRGVKINAAVATGDDPIRPGDVIQVGKRRWTRFVLK
ncbi:MAG TPA: tyrosine--tRNA ligase [Candidatus Dormibacteraeota bacterium]|nr:tyrosine--tRNA ligase [Candidatus Dormibacteraeota bacterium]